MMQQPREFKTSVEMTPRMRRFMTTLLDIIEKLATVEPESEEIADAKQENARAAAARSAITAINEQGTP